MMITTTWLKMLPLFTVVALAAPQTQGAETWSRATAGEEVLSLDGTWRFTIDAAKAAASDAAGWDALPVPGNWDLRPAYATHKGEGWYQREFTVPASWPAERRLRLRFEAVYHDAEVTLNGRVLGTHSGGYTPFEFDVTDAVRRDRPNTLTVRADNRYRRGAWWAWGGISRSVTLRANGDVRIVYQHIRSEPDLGKGTARLFITCKVANAGPKAVEARLAPSIRALGIVRDGVASAGGAKDLGAAALSVTVPAGGTAEASVAIDLDAAQVKLWHFDHPNLYASLVTLTVDGQVRHARRDRFGIRKVEIKPDGLWLNGERVRVPGFNRVSDSNTTGNTEPDELVRRDVDLMKSASAVFSRLMHSPQAPNLQDYMDERGLMIVAEIPVWGEGDPQVVPDNPVTKRWLREMVERDYNHACVVGWSTGNEIVNHFDYVRTMNDHVRKELDPHRMVGYASYTAFRGEASPATDGVTHSDVAMLNVYSGKAQDFLNLIHTVRRRWPEKPIFMSEFGVGQIGVGEKAKVPNFEAIWAALGQEPYVIGGALWTFNDYRSDYQGTPPSGNREWGVVDVERNLKPGYAEVRRAFAPVRGLSFAQSKIWVAPRAVNELPSYTLKGYAVRWVEHAAEGATPRTGVIELPEVRPGAEVLELVVDARALAGATLISPTGYSVLEATPTP